MLGGDSTGPPVNLRQEAGVCRATGLGWDQVDNVFTQNTAGNYLISRAYFVTRYITRSAGLQ